MWAGRIAAVEGAPPLGLSSLCLTWQPAGDRGSIEDSPWLLFRGEGGHPVFPKNHQRTTPKSFSLALVSGWSKELSVGSMGVKMTGLGARRTKGQVHTPAGECPGLSEPRCSPLEITHSIEWLGVYSGPVDACGPAWCQAQSSGVAGMKAAVAMSS